MRQETEIERRWLVKSIDPDILRGEPFYIQQGYFDTPQHVALRVRLTSGVAKITHKSGAGIKREERSFDVPENLGKLLIENCTDRLNKRRYTRDGWEVDFYDGALAGLVIAEKELLSEDEPCELPSWIHDAVEVTDWLTNRHLARFGRDILSGLHTGAARNGLRKAPISIVLTGSPCSGKSTLMRLIIESGLNVMCVPETATLLIKEVGIIPDKDNLGVFQKSIRSVQMGIEEAALQQAAIKGCDAVIFDRGVLDGAAYMPEGLSSFEELFRTTRKFEWDRYSAVVLLDTPREEIYNKHRGNNSARTETWEEACAVGQKLRGVWQGHDNFFLVPDDDSWEKRASFAIAIIKKIIGR